MLQALLADRFKLTLHRNSHALPVYALVVAKGGPRLQPAASGADAPTSPPPQGSQTINTGNGTVTVSQAKTPGAGATATITGGKSGRAQITMVDGHIRMVAAKMTMCDFANMLTPMLTRPVIDQTDLPGAYQVSVAVSTLDMLAMARCLQHPNGHATSARDPSRRR